MKYTISARNMNVSEGLKEKILNKMTKLEKFFNEGTNVNITLSKENKNFVIEVTIPLKGFTVRAEERAETVMTAVDSAVDVLERQLLKHRKKIINKHRQAKEIKFTYFEEDHDLEEEKIKIVRTKKFAMKPMDTEEACMEMDLLGHDFFVFRNRDTNEVNVVYKRHNGDYGLIEPAF